tara:strand:+ start:110 stop:385 length:276 start_codon:yes stop_codon:yes gene_type:complete
MLFSSNPNTIEEMDQALQEVYAEANVVMFPQTRGERRNLGNKRRQVNSLLQRYIAISYSMGWKEKANEIAKKISEMQDAKDKIRESVENLF